MRYLTTLISLGLLFIVFLFYQREYESLRYHKTSCQYQVLNLSKELKSGVDYAFFGSSRSLEAVNAKMIEKELSLLNQDENDVVVLDLSRSWRGNGMTFVMVRDLLAKQTVRNVVVEVNVANRFVYHGYWKNAARYSDLIKDISSRDDLNIAARLQLFFNHLGGKIGDDFAAVIMNRVPSGSPSGRIKANRDCSSKYGSERPDQRLKAAQKNADWMTNFYEWDLDSPVESRNDYYLKKIVELGKESQVNVHFIYFNTSYSSRLSAAFLQDFEKRYGAPLKSVQSVDTLNAFYDVGYRDITHMNLVGQALFSKWFVNELRE